MRIPIHPGMILAEDLQALNMSANRLSEIIKVPANRVTQILRGQRAITADTARRLAKFFGTSPEYWMNLQMIYEIDLDRQQANKEQEIETIPQYNVCLKNESTTNPARSI